MAAEGRSRRWIWIVLLICVAIFAYNLIADRLTPYSSQATVQAYIVSVAPEVAGKVVEIGVVDNQIAKEGELLFRLDPQAYEVAVREAEAAVDLAGQSIGANTAGIAAAEAALADARSSAASAALSSGLSCPCGPSFWRACSSCASAWFTPASASSSWRLA